MNWSWEHAEAVLPTLLMAFLKVTLLVTIVSSIGAAVLGLLWAVVLREAPRVVAAIVFRILDVIRMTPIPLQLAAIWAFVLTTDIDPLTVGLIVYAVHYSTYMAESYRAGIESIRPGQWEAATALSMSKARTWQAVIIPQALRATLPSLGNWAIAMFKDTPFLIMISVPEMVTEAQAYGGSTFSYDEPIILAGLIFLAASYPTAVLMRKLENRLATY
ncbi:amino acid ABC transporter permease [Ruania alba]|uniref:Amino acid ABC transporter membrane protein 2, PAAT family n=1 Tax=Ruania alba TaxID=648782 RepID=A0A1H5D686_9MICO|nr:amino acid ABC transporter permease [Ruania alba]SED74248.1 amino acid ABC transporter membrane protein 2, PAAT family [Ruania alba]